MSELADALVQKANEQKPVDAIGLDIGTSFVNATYVDAKGDIKTKSIRSAFIPVERNPRYIKLLQKNPNNTYIDTGDKLYLLGQSAIDMATLFNAEVNRPMSRGVLSATEKEAIAVMRMLVKEVLKGLTQEGTTVVYSSPADPVDGSFSTLYHQTLMKEILEGDIGVKAEPMNESHALGYSSLQDDDFTGLCFSFGAGMVNAVMVYAGMDTIKFSIPNGGDWVDQKAAEVRGESATVMQQIKEQGIDIQEPVGPDAQALSIYYKDLIKQAITAFNARFSDSKDAPRLTQPIPVIYAGGTTKAGGFGDIFKAVVEREGLPFSVSEVRPANDALFSVAEGLLLAAME